MKIGSKLKFLRKQKNITQSVIADILGVSFQAYSLYEKDLREPTFSIIAKICNYYNVSTDFLFLDEFNEDIFFVELYLSSIKSKTLKLIKELAFISKYGSDMTERQYAERSNLISSTYENLKDARKMLNDALRTLGISEKNMEEYYFYR